MAKNKSQQEFVKEITPRSDDFAQWYTDVILKTDLVDYAPVRGCMVIKPYGYAALGADPGSNWTAEFKRPPATRTSTCPC